MIYRANRAQFKRIRRLSKVRILSSVAVMVGALAFALVTNNVLADTSQARAAAKLQIASQKRHAHKPKRGSAHGASTTSPKPSPTATPTADTTTFRSTNCNQEVAASMNFASSSSPQIRKLAQYEQLCPRAFDTMSFFVPTPGNANEARAYAADAAAQLKQFAAAGIKPVVFMEPNNNAGLLDLSLYSNGSYEQAFEVYFNQLKTAGITDSTMGTWVPIPEGNLPEWSSVDPNVFASAVTKTAQIQKKYFPGSKVSLLLDSQSYPTATSWNGGTYVSLVPYVRGIPSGLIDSFGVQGFPWSGPANEGGETNYSPKTYLRSDLAVEAARALGISKVWFNTGTFARMYANNAKQTVSLTPAQRQTMLDGVMEQARTVQASGLSVSIHLFAENKASVAEGIDWSYWNVAPRDEPSSAVLAAFINDAKTAGIPLWLYDAIK